MNPGLNTVTPRYFQRGRQAGLRAHEAWFIAFPWRNHSGVLINPHSLTVAGAAQASHLFPVSSFLSTERKDT